MGKPPRDQPAARSTGPGERSAGTAGLGAKVKHAFRRVTSEENLSLPPPSPDEEIVEDGQKPRSADFPSRELRAAFIALGTWALGLSVVTKIVVALCLGAAIAVPVVVPILRQTPDVRTYYVQHAEPLQPVPHPTAFEPLAELERNTEVEVLRSEEGYALVRTQSARVGFVTKSSVSRDRVEVIPEEPFTNCTVRWNEKSPSLCHLRATAQQEHCSALCAEKGSPNECTTACATNLAMCMESCSGVRPREEPPPAPATAAVPDPTAPTPTPTPTEAVAVPRPAPIDRPEGVVQLMPATTPAPKEEKKAKKKRRKKRRRRRPADTATVRMPEME